MVGRGGANLLLCALLCGLGKTTASTSMLSGVQAEFQDQGRGGGIQHRHLTGAPSSLHGGLMTRGSPLEAQFHTEGRCGWWRQPSH